jgi:hypothetical protein
MTGDHISILRSHNRRLAKLVDVDGNITAYDKVRTFDICERPINDLTALGGWLRWLLDRPDCCVVRGAILDLARTECVRRLLYPDPKTGDLATLRDVARRWLALDFDSLPRPECVHTDDLQACAAAAIERLPQEFRSASCIVQATASHGIKPGLRLRLWHWLDRPTTGTELKTWLRVAPIDMSLFGGAQPIYTAAPIFLDCRDHLPARLAWLPGEATVRVPSPELLAPLPRKSRPALPVTNQGEARDYTHAALVMLAQKISSATEGERHRALIAACCKLAPLLQAGTLDESTVREVARRAAGAAGMADPNEIESAISWAFARPYPFGGGTNG